MKTSTPNTPTLPALTRTSISTRAAAPTPAELADLLEATGRGDRAAFADFYDATSARVYGAVLRVLRDRGFSEECVQDVYLEVWQKAPSFSRASGSPAAWLITMAHRRAIDRVRSEQSRSDRESKYAMLEDALGAPSDTASGFADKRPVRAALSGLPLRQRECLFMTYFEGLTYAEAAHRVGIPVSTMKSRIRSALANLRSDPTIGCLAD